MAERRSIRRIPIDFGSVHGNLYCRRHGMQVGGLVIKVDTYLDKEAVTKTYCGHCVLDALDSMTHPVTVQTRKDDDE